MFGKYCQVYPYIMVKQTFIDIWSFDSNITLMHAW